MCGGLGKRVIWDMRSIFIFFIALVRSTLKLSYLVISAILYSLHLRYEHYCHTTQSSAFLGIKFGKRVHLGWSSNNFFF